MNFKSLIACIAVSTFITGTMAQSAADTSVPSRSDASAKPEITSPTKSYSPADGATVTNENGNSRTPKNEKKPKKKADFQFFKENGMTLYYGRSSSFLVNKIATTMDNELTPTFGEITITTNKPNHYGYQFHFRDRWMMGLVFQSASTRTNTIEYPDYNTFPTVYSKFHYQVRLTSFMGTLDYAWKIKSGKRTNTAWYSGIALGTFNVNFETIRDDSSTAYVPAYNQGIGMNGIQATLVGVKTAWKNGMGVQAQLGAGVNSIGFSFGINYSFK